MPPIDPKLVKKIIKKEMTDKKTEKLVKDILDNIEAKEDTEKKQNIKYCDQRNVRHYGCVTGVILLWG